MHGTCFTDGVGNHGRYERCTVQALVDVFVSASQYVVTGGDYITMYPVGGSGIMYQATGTPPVAVVPTDVALPAGSTMTWRSDSSGYSAGFTICATTSPPPVPPGLPPFPPGTAPPPPMPPGALWRIAYTSMRTTMEGPVPSCHLSGASCVTDGPLNHGNSERCTFLALQNMYVTATYYVRLWRSNPRPLCDRARFCCSDGHRFDPHTAGDRGALRLPLDRRE